MSLVNELGRPWFPGQTRQGVFLRALRLNVGFFCIRFSSDWVSFFSFASVSSGFVRLLLGGYFTHGSAFSCTILSCLSFSCCFSGFLLIPMSLAMSWMEVPSTLAQMISMASCFCFKYSSSVLSVDRWSIMNKCYSSIA